MDIKKLLIINIIFASIQLISVPFIIIGFTENLFILGIIFSIIMAISWITNFYFGLALFKEGKAIHEWQIQLIGFWSIITGGGCIINIFLSLTVLKNMEINRL